MCVLVVDGFLDCVAVAVAVAVTVTRGVPCPVPDVVISRVRHDSNGTLIRYSYKTQKNLYKILFKQLSVKTRIILIR